VRRASRPSRGVASERGLSINRLAKEIGVSQSHLWRLVHGKAPVPRPRVPLIERVARALAVPPSYFAESREHLVLEAVKNDPTLRDELYDQLAGSKRRRARRRGDHGAT